MKAVQEKESVMGVKKKPSLVIAVWHHSASLVMTDSDPRDGIFYLPLTPMIDPYKMPQSLRVASSRKEEEKRK